MTHRRLVSTCVSVAVIVIGLVGCGGSPSPTPSTSTDGTPLTSEQATVLARTLYRSYEERGATFQATAQIDADVRLVMSGRVNFRASSGQMLLQVARGGGPLSAGRDIVWTKNAVFEGDIPGLEAAMAKRGRPGVTWVERTVDVQASPVDAVVSLITRLASTRPDNPILVQQDDNVFLGSQPRDGETLQTFRLANRLVLDIGSDGTIRQARAQLAGANVPVAVTLSSYGPRQIVVPPAGTRVKLSSIRGLYRQLIADA